MRAQTIGWKRALAAAILAALAGRAAADASAPARQAAAPIRQPTLIQPIPPSELEPPAPRAPAPPPATVRQDAPAPDQERFYDPGLPGYRSLQKAHEALAGFPVDRGGFVDWSAALASGRISPRAEVGGAGAVAPHDLDVVLRNTKEMPWVRFPHRAHSQWLGCASCHPAPFAEKAGAAAITMETIFRGGACGMCHGKVAFPAWFQCERCHNIAPAGGRALHER